MINIATADQVNAWLTPAIRKAIHTTATALGALVLLWSLADPETVQVWQVLVLAVGGLASQILAALVARRVDMTVIYASAAAVIAALGGVGLFDQAATDRVTQTLAIVLMMAGAWTVSRTDTTTPTGTPAAEVVSDAAKETGVPTDPTTDPGPSVA